MADVSVNVGVTGISQFKSGMSDAQASIKGIDAALKLNEKQMAANGRAEDALAAKTELLNRKLEKQKEIAKNAEKALKQMDDNGVNKSGKAYQDMQRKMIEAQSAMLDTQAEIEQLGTKAETASGKTDQLATSLGGLSKKVSLEQVSSVVNKISDGLEKGAKKAVELGKAIWENITDTARFSDDTATQAMMLNMNVEDYQAYKKVFDTVGEITVQEWQKAKQKVQKAVLDTSDEQYDIFAALGIGLRDVNGKISPYYNKYVTGTVRDWEDVFWDIGKALRDKVESGELTQDQADVYANALFGKSFANLNSMFSMGREEFERQVDEQVVASEEAIKKNAELNDTLIKLQSDFTSLKDEVLSGLAPALTDGANAIDSLLGKVMDYLKTPEGQEALKNMETAVSGLFEDLGKIDPEQVVEGFTGVFDKIVGGFKWLDENKESIGNILKGVAIAWGAAKITGGALDILKLVDGLKGLTGAGAAAAAGEAGAAAGTSFATGFTNAFIAAAPMLASILGVTAVAITPAAAVMEEVKKKWGEDYERRMEAAGKAGENESLIRTAAEALGKDGQVDFGTVEELLMGLQARKNQQKAELHNMLNGSITAGSSTWNVLNEFWNGAELDPTVVNELVQDITDAFAENANKAKVPVEVQLPENVQSEISEQIGTVTVYVEPILGGTGYTKRTPRRSPSPFGFANGLPNVPFDGFYFLHQNEQVMPAREVASRNFSSNMYVEKMIMNNGQDAEGLASRIAAENQRVMSGFGGV